MGGKHRQASWWRDWQERRQVRRGLVKSMVDGDGNEHLITLGALRQGLSEGSRHYLAVCGRLITVGGMAAPPTSFCSQCVVLGPRS